MKNCGPLFGQSKIVNVQPDAVREYPKANASREVFWSRYLLFVISFSLKHWKSDWIYTSMKTFFLFHEKIMTFKKSGVFPNQMEM